MNTKQFLLTILFALLLTACGTATPSSNEVLGLAVDDQVVPVADDHDEDHTDTDLEMKAVDHHADEEVMPMADDHHASSEMHAPDPIANAREIQIVATEFGFEPNVVQLKAGEAVNIVLVNEGVIPHELEISAFDFHLHAETGETLIGGFVPAETGRFELGCYISGHFENGMSGEIEVDA
jgi:uncharacterized cupredoxin-like copper-binding protein